MSEMTYSYNLEWDFSNHCMISCFHILFYWKQICSLISGIYDDDQEIITLSRSDFGMLISWCTRSVYDRRV